MGKKLKVVRGDRFCRAFSCSTPMAEKRQVPVHAGMSIKLGALKGILKDVKVHPDDLRELL